VRAKEDKNILKSFKIGAIENGNKNSDNITSAFIRR
jgi:hypothetical protein